MYRFTHRFFLCARFNGLSGPQCKHMDNTSDDSLLLIFQSFNSLIYGFQFNLKKKKQKKKHVTHNPCSAVLPCNKWRSQPSTLINVLIQSSPGRNNASMGDKFPSVHFLCLSYGWCWAGDGPWGGGGWRSYITLRHPCDSNMALSLLCLCICLYVFSVQ